MPDVPVIPIGQWGAQEFLDLYHRHFRPWPRKQVTLSVGPPVDLSRYRGLEASSANLAAITDTIMHGVADQLAEIRKLPPPTQFYDPDGAQVDGQPRAGGR
jgi:1-acyl-sn-glycerol-3-phosphate acyltransferase